MNERMPRKLSIDENIALDEEEDSLPSVSVIIPAGRGERVQQHLESIHAQKYPRENFEIIIVSPCQFEPRFDARIVKTEQLFYPGKMRNIGARFASNDYLLFLDDDCDPEPDWIKCNVSLLRNKEIGAVSGMISSAGNSLAHRFYDFTNFGLCQTNTPCSRILCSATFGIRKDVFQAVGGFDESLRTVEDNDICLRINQKGYKTFYDPSIKVVHHHDRTSFLKVLQYMYSGGYYANLILAKRYPGFSFTSKLFRKIQHPFFYLLFIVPVATLNTLVCLKHNFKEHPKIIFFTPLILLAKLAYHIGVLSALIRKNDV